MKNKSFKKNISWVFFENLSHSIFTFLINIFVARILSKEAYGNINYIFSWISFFNSFAILGINNIINKFLSEDQKESNEYLNSAIVMRFIASIISIICVCLLIFVLEKNNTQMIYITLIYSTYFISEIGQIYVYWFRYKREANLVAILRIIALLISAIVKVVALLIFKNIYLYIFGIVIELFMFSILLFLTYKRKYDFKLTISKEKMKKILKSSYPFISASLLITIYAQTDKIMLKNMMGANEVASYSIAVTIAGLMGTFASAIIEGFRPEIISTYKKDKNIYAKRLRQLYCFIFWICIAYGVFVTLFSKQMITILYGKKYFSSIPALAIIVWYTSFSYFGSANNVYLAAESKEKYAQITTLIGAITNVILNLVLIPKMGIVGAALASLITQFVANFGILIIIKDLRPIVTHMIDGILFKDVFDKNIFKISKS